jgi:hypothetical protein
VGQGTIGSDNPEGLRRTDVQVMLKRAIMRREIKALLEGRPLTPWTERSVYETDPRLTDEPETSLAVTRGIRRS